MGKRSSFERRAGDFYLTPKQAVEPLIPHLRGARRFAEPCAGDGALVRHLESFGLRCVYQGDIATGQDALARTSYGEIDAIITNPPYERRLMHALIAHFQRIAPTWLLLDVDWATTERAAPYLPHCSDIVILPRVRWIAGTKKNGKDNHAWYRFDARHRGGPIFHANGALPLASRCEQCGVGYRPQRSDSQFCSNACRQRAYRARLTVTQP